MGYFDIDYNVKAWQNLPVRLRQTVQYAWLKVLLRPVMFLAGLFKANREANIYDLKHNGQVCFMEAVLNDTFDPALRRIFIDDPAYIDPLYLFPPMSLRPVYLGLASEAGTTIYPDPQWLYLRTELYSGGGVQFIIHVPAGLAVDLPRMRALTDKYRLVSKNNYAIVSP